MIIDTHAHFIMGEDNFEEFIDEMQDNIIIVSGTDTKTNKEVLTLCQNNKNIYGTLGLHPTELANITDDDLLFIEKNLNNKKIIAVGEIGLDFYWSKDNIDKQIKYFEKQIVLAKKYNKPIVIHSRSADFKVLEILKKYPAVKKVMHCYSGDYNLAKEYVNINTMFGIGGVLTFKNAQTLQDVVKNVPLTSLILETDSPFLSPIRGSKNYPKNVKIVAMKIAEIKGISYDGVVKVTTENVISQFDLNI